MVIISHSVVLGHPSGATVYVCVVIVADIVSVTA